MMTRRKKLKGQALVEFALVLPLIIFLLLSFFDVGIHFFLRLSMDKAVHGALCEASKVGPSGFTKKALYENIRQHAMGVKLTEDAVKVSKKPGQRPGWSKVRVEVRFKKPTVTGMYVTRFNDLQQLVIHERYLPREVVGE